VFNIPVSFLEGSTKAANLDLPADNIWANVALETPPCREDTAIN